MTAQYPPGRLSLSWVIRSFSFTPFGWPNVPSVSVAYSVLLPSKPSLSRLVGGSLVCVVCFAIQCFVIPAILRKKVAARVNGTPLLLNQATK